jgi:hypothetical protein
MPCHDEPEIKPQDGVYKLKKGGSKLRRDKKSERAVISIPLNDLSSVAAGVCRKASDQPNPVATQKH